MEAGHAVDGRVRRSQRSRASMVQALFDLVGEGILQPTGQQVAERARVGLRTVFRHFSDLLGWLPELRRAPSELLEAFDVALSFEVWDRLRSDQRLGRQRASAALGRIVAALVNTLPCGKLEVSS